MTEQNEQNKPWLSISRSEDDEGYDVVLQGEHDPIGGPIRLSDEMTESLLTAEDWNELGKSGLDIIRCSLRIGVAK